MSKISITYPESGLSPSISLVNSTTGVVDFTGTMTEIVTTKVYVYEFTEAVNTDYAFTITTPGYDDVVDMLFYESTAGGLTPTQATQLANTVKKGDVILNKGSISIPL